MKLLGLEYRPFYTRILVSKPKLAKIRISAIILYGYCNFQCIYCKRDGLFRNGDGSIITAEDYDFSDIKEFINLQTKFNDRMIRISGGDPLMMNINDFIKIAEYTKSKKLMFSIATNMSIPEKIVKMLEYIDYLAGDFKAPRRYFSKITSMPEKFYELTKESWRLWSENDNVEAEVRIPVFPFTEFADIVEIVDFLTTLPKMPILVLRAYRSVKWLAWKSTEPKHIISLARAIAKEYSIPVLIRIRWRTGTLLAKPDGAIEDVRI